MRAERELVPVPTEHVDAWARFDTFIADEHEHLYKALYFVTGSREDAEDLSQEAFMKLWERWDRIDEIEDPTGYLFRIALNGFRMRRRRWRCADTHRYKRCVTDSWRRRCAPMCDASSWG
jgi:RNA polymerase sigma factor (sigma-70 family)